MLNAPSPAPCPGARSKCWERELAQLADSLPPSRPGLACEPKPRAWWSRRCQGRSCGRWVPFGGEGASRRPGQRRDAPRGGMFLGAELWLSRSPIPRECSRTPPACRTPAAVRASAPGAGGGLSPGRGSPAWGGPALPPLPSPPPGPCRSRRSEPSRTELSRAAGTERTPCGRGERRGCGGHRAPGAAGDGGAQVVREAGIRRRLRDPGTGRGRDDEDPGGEGSSV